MCVPSKPTTDTYPVHARPKAVVDFRFVNPIAMYEPNANYNTAIVGLAVVVAAGGNGGAVGVRLRGAQGSGVEDVSIVFQGDSGMAGVVGGCGSGGAHHGITVTGGRCVLVWLWCTLWLC